MPLIQLKTFINAQPQTVFELSCSVDVHKASMMEHDEKIIDGVRQGVMKQGDTVTWTARHFFKTRSLKVTITSMQAPHSFTDEMLAGDFKRLRHLHQFIAVDGGTLMKDDFYFETPFGVIGRLVNFLYLKQYMKALLQKRNSEIKRLAEEGH